MYVHVSVLATVSVQEFFSLADLLDLRGFVLHFVLITMVMETLASMDESERRDIFELAAGTGADACMTQPGFAGIVLLLDGNLTEQEVSQDKVEAAFKVLDWAEDKSLAWIDFQALLRVLVEVEESSIGSDEEGVAATVRDAAEPDDPGTKEFFEVLAERMQQQAFPWVKPDELRGPKKEVCTAEEILGAIQKSEYVELESYLAQRRQLYFASNPGEKDIPQKVQDVEWARRFYYAELQRFLTEKSLKAKKLAHKVVDGVFVSLIPPSSMEDPIASAEATTLSTQMKASHLEAFEVMFWQEWEKSSTVLSYIEGDPMEVFEKFIATRYYGLMKELQDIPCAPAFIPKVAVELNADEPTQVQRRDLSNLACAADGVAAEARVLEDWATLKKDSGLPNLSSEPPAKYWNTHYWPALEHVLKLGKLMQCNTGKAGADAKISAAGDAGTAGSTTLATSKDTAQACSGVDSIAALMGGGGYVTTAVPEVLEFKGSKTIQEDSAPGSLCQYEGILVHYDETSRSLARKDSGDSPMKKARTVSSVVVDMLILDKTGPITFSLSASQEDVDRFLMQANSDKRSQRIISLSVVRIGELPQNNWNGNSLTRCHTLTTVYGNGAVAGTLVTFPEQASSPFLLTSVFVAPSAVACISVYGPVSAQMKPPFRSTIRGWVSDVQSECTTQQGTSKRLFKLVDGAGAFIQCCALVHNVNNSAIKNEREVIVYYGTGRGPIGNVPGMLYIMKDSMIIGVGVKIEPSVLAQQVVIQ